jgi:hypothetical protein
MLRCEATPTPAPRHARPRPPGPLRWRNPLLGLAVVAIAGLAACGAGSPDSASLRSYMASVEPIRLGVNHLLEGADPMLDQYRAHRLTGQEAADAMGRLERTFAAYARDISALQPPDASLDRINAAYAHTYILEDSYLSALVAALPDGQFATLPATQSEQRAAIIEWRIQLEVIGRAVGLTLPADLQQAGRGEIAPSVSGAS